MLLEIDKELYQDCVTYENGEMVMYVELLKALYGTIWAACLFWEKLSKKLMEWGFSLNPYDSCIANKMVNGSQLTVVWHVNDLKLSHKEQCMVDLLIDQLNEEFGKEGPLNLSQGMVHDYLGMELDFTNPGSVLINMEASVNNMLCDVSKDMEGTAVTPVSSHLFQVNKDDPVLLCNEQKDIFVCVMQALYLSQHGRPDIRMAVSFLCGQLQSPDTDDYQKLTQLIKYLHKTVDLMLTLGADDNGSIQWWIDASYSVHPDMKGHTRATMSLGQGSVYSGSWKQKLITCSSTESELVGVYDVLPQVMWTAKFLCEQGMDLHETILYQDNMSSILLAKNGLQSSTKRTKHMDICYFYVADQVKKKQLWIEHCPTKEMLADFFTKPLQGGLFTKLWDIILGVNQATCGSPDSRSVLGNDTTSQAHNGETHPGVGLKVPLPEEQLTDVHTSDAQAIHPIKANTDSQQSYHDIVAGPKTMSSSSTSCAQTHKIKLTVNITIYWCTQHG